MSPSESPSRRPDAHLVIASMSQRNSASFRRRNFLLPLRNGRSKLRFENLEPRLCLASELDWVMTTGVSGYETYDGIKVDPQGNMYVSTATELIKFSAERSKLWTVPIRDAWQIDLDAAGNVYASGEFTSLTVPGVSGNVIVSSHGRTDIYVVKFNPEGKALWGRALGGAGDERSGLFTVDDDGTVYIGGMFFETSTFGSTQLTSAGVGDGFISKLTTDGDFVWTRAISGTHYESVRGVDVDHDGNIYITGHYYGQVSLPGVSGALTLGDPGTYDSMFIAKLNSAGQFVWAHGPYTGNAADAGTVLFDPTGSIVIAGSYLGPVDFDPGPGVVTLPYHSYGSGNYDLYVTRFDLNGNLIWAKGMGGAASESLGEVALGPEGNIYLVGRLNGEADFDPSGFDYFLTSPGQDAFVAALNAQGEFVSARTWGGTSVDYSVGVATDAAGNVYVTGNFYGQTPVDFDPGPGTQMRSSVGPQDGFLMKFRRGSSAIATRLWHDLDGDGLQEEGEPALAGAVVELFSTHDTTIGNLYDGSRELVITDETGAVRFDNLASGNYYLKVHAPVGFQFSPANVGDDDSLDSDVLSDGTTALIVLQTDQEQTNFGLGLVGATPDFGVGLAFGSSGINNATAVTTDADGNLYVTGSFQGTVDFDYGPATVSLTAQAMQTSSDAFVAKYTAGGALVWVKSYGNTTSDAGGYELTVDAEGNVVAAINYNSSIDVDPSYLVRNIVRSISGADTLLIKLDRDGNPLWHQTLGGSGHDYLGSLATDAAGNLYLGGYFQGTRDFDPATNAEFNLTSAGSTDAYVLKLTAAGKFVWARRWGGTGAESVRDIAVDAAGQVATVGNFAGTVDFDPGATTRNLTSAGNLDAFVSNLNADGSLAWAVRYGNSADDFENNGVAFDHHGNVLVAGGFSGTVNFGSGANATLSSSGNLDGYVAKWTDAGQFAWVRQFGGTDIDVAYGVTVDADAAIYATGSYSATAYFRDGYSTFVRTSQSNTDAFVQKWSTAGEHLAFYNLPGSQINRGHDLLVNSLTGQVLVAGQFRGTADLNPGLGSFTVTSQNLGAFITKFRQDEAQPWISLASRPITENQGIQIVGEITLHDLPLDDPFTLQLFQTPAGIFSIEDGNLLIADTNLLDYELPPSLTIGIRAVSEAGHVVEQLFTITLLNLNEQPTIAPLSDALVPFNTPFTRAGSFVDPDAGDTWTAMVNYGNGSGDVPLTLAANRTFTLSHTYATIGMYTVTVTVTDAGGLSHTRSMNVEVAYLPLPVLAVAGSHDGVRGETLTFLGQLTGALPAGVNSITWNFGDGTTPVTVPTTAAWQNQTHVFTEVGDYVVTLRLQLADGRTVTRELPVEITSTSLRVDQSDPSFTTLVVGGTMSGDVIRVRSTTETELQVYWQRSLLGTYENVDRVVVYGQSGNDLIMAAAANNIELWSFGGDGNDLLIGSDGNDVLLGDAGNDLLLGRGGRDLSIGGSGSDALLDADGEDVQIAGTLTLPDLPVGLGNIMNEWTSSRSFVDRVNNLKGDLSGNYANADTLLLVNQTVFNDTATDFLWGGSTSDWFFASDDDDLVADHWFNDFVDNLAE